MDKPNLLVGSLGGPCSLSDRLDPNGDINPAPWTRVVHIPHQVAVSTKSENWILRSKSSNPFKEKLFCSLFQNRLELLNKIDNQNARLESICNIAAKILPNAEEGFNYNDNQICTSDATEFKCKTVNYSPAMNDCFRFIDYESENPSSNGKPLRDAAAMSDDPDMFLESSVAGQSEKKTLVNAEDQEGFENKKMKNKNRKNNMFDRNSFRFLSPSFLWRCESSNNQLASDSYLGPKNQQPWNSNYKIGISHDDRCVGKFAISDPKENLEFQNRFVKSEFSNSVKKTKDRTTHNPHPLTSCNENGWQVERSEISNQEQINVVPSTISSAHNLVVISTEDYLCPSKSEAKDSFDSLWFPEEDFLGFSSLCSTTVDSTTMNLKTAFEVQPKITFDSSVSCSDSGIGIDDEACLITHPDDESNFNSLSSVEEVLCGSRVSQMTQTYHDIEAVTRLLQEKEKDLELAARIGQQLLARNKALEEKNSVLESEVITGSEKITQLKHDLQMKTDLLQIYTNDIDESSTENTPTGLRFIHLDLLQHKVQKLEHENVSLREEACQLASDTYECEEKEKDLVTDVIKQLNDANHQVNQLSEELSKKLEESIKQQEDTTQLLAQVVEVQSTNKRLVRENDELASLVGVARECQQELTTELADLKEKYAEVLDLLHDTQEQLRKNQKRTLPGSRNAHLGGLYSSAMPSGDSIATELFSLNSSTDDLEKSHGTKNLSRVFDTVRLSSKLGSSMSSLNANSVYSTPTKQSSLSGGSHMNPHVNVGGRFSPYFGGRNSSHASSGLPSLDSGADSDGSFPTDSEDNYPASRNGVPGWPGTPDLNSCLRRLGSSSTASLTSSYLPYGCRTPDSIMSTGSKSAISGYGSGEWKLPQKLQIVKPIEGSQTLHQWSRLATPHLGGLLEQKDGVAIKGATNTDINLELYSLSDYEEDDDEKEYPGKQFMYTSGIYTFTNSTVLHPDDITNLTPSLRQSQTSVITSSVATSLPSAPPTPSHGMSQSRRGSTATFSTNVGLAKHLLERGVPGNQESMIPTATPANSPDSSRPCSPEPYSYKLPGLDDLTKSIHAGASYLKRTLYGPYDSPPGTPDGPKVRIVERVQALGGVNRFVSSGTMTHSIGGVVTARAQPPSPLLHLSNLIRAQTTANEASSTVVSGGSIMSTPKITSPGERRPRPPAGAPMGIPGQPGAGHLSNRLTQLKPGQRIDLGTVGGRLRPKTLCTGSKNSEDEIGSVNWMSFGRKGGLL